MRVFRFVVLGLLLDLGVLASPRLVSQEPTPATHSANESEHSIDFWMEKKLSYSTSILRGLALNDFGMIQTSARQMRLLNKVEGFARGRNPEYRKQVTTFERVTDELIRQAEKKNSDGVAIAFNHLTVSCVRCHEILREDATND